jgi:peptide/nickel transport system substrate-binding protein
VAHSHLHASHRRTGRFVAAVAVIGLSVSAFAGVGSASTSTATPAAKSGGDLTFGVEYGTTAFCPPSQQWAISGIQIASAIYDTLVVPNSKGKMVPYLAEAVTPNAENTVWTIKLRPDIKFQNGEALDATALKLNLDAYTGKVKVTPAALLIPLVLPFIDQVDVIDPLSVNVTLKQPIADFMAYLWFQAGRMVIAAPEQINSPDCATKMIGTGPFKLDSISLPNGPIKTVRNPDYWQKGYPKANSITFITQPDGVQRDNGLKGGQFDIIHQSGALQIDDLKSQGGGITLLEQKPGLREIRYELLNTSKAPFDDPDARLAYQYAIDRNKINELINGGLFDVANSLMDKSAPGYEKNAGYAKFNKKKAQELVDKYKAAHGGVFEVTFLTSGPDAQNKAQAEELKAEVEAVGITANVSQVEQTVLISNAVSGQFSVFLWRNLHGGNTESCDADIAPWFSNNPPDLVNFARFTDPETQAIIDKIRAATSPANVKAACTEFNEAMAKKGYLLPSWYIDWTIAAAKGVKINLPALPDGGGKPLFVYGRIPVLGLSKS